jgi:hypothetical protein
MGRATTVAWSASPVSEIIPSTSVPWRLIGSWIDTTVIVLAKIRLHRKRAIRAVFTAEMWFGKMVLASRNWGDGMSQLNDSLRRSIHQTSEL